MRTTVINPSGALSRRDFIARASGATLAAGLDRVAFAAGAGQPQCKVAVGALPWVYAATLPGRDITPLLPQIFADFPSAGSAFVAKNASPRRNRPLTGNILEPEFRVSRVLPPLPRHHRGATSAFDRKGILSVAASASEWTRGIHSLALAATNVQFLERRATMDRDIQGGRVKPAAIAGGHSLA
jgi:hypothetical protein